MQFDYFLVYFSLILFGLCLGSFAGALVWRLRAKQLKQDMVFGEKVNADECKHLDKLTKSSVFNDRSRCLSCGYVLKWYDLLPLVSWIILRGKCRKCHKPIGFLEPLVELGVAIFFVLSYAFWPYKLDDGLEIARLVLWLIASVPLAISFIYDAKWSLLDRRINYTLIIIGICSAMLLIIGAPNKLESLFSIIGSVLILSGLYYGLYKVSSGKWVGDGDSVLGLGLALLLADWKLAFVALFSANLVGCIIVLPAMLMKKIKRDSRVPFGPLLILGFIVAGLAGNYLINIYFYSLL